MALLIRGKTKCLLCGSTIADEDDVVAFPAFLGASHRLARFSDGAFHKHCFSECAEQREVESLYRRYREIWENRPASLMSAAEIEAWGKEAFKEFA